MKYKKGKQMFYKNIPCKFIAEVDRLNSVVFVEQLYVENGDYHEQSYIESNELPIIAETKYLSEKKNDINLFKEFDDLVSAKRKKRNEIQAKIRELEDKKGELEKYFINTSKKHEQLKYINDFMDGKITHYVYPRYGGVIIFSINDKEGRCFYDDTSHRLLCLEGDSDRHIKWKLSMYGDGSGSSDEVIPCISLEMAKKEATKEIENLIKNRKEYAVFSRNNDTVNKFNLKPEGWNEYVIWHEKRAKANKEKKKKELQKKLDAIK